MIDTLVDVLKDLEAVTPARIKRLAKTLAPVEKGEKVLGTVPLRVQRLWCLGAEYERLMSLTDHAVLFDLDDPKEKSNYQIVSRRYRLMGDLVRALAWIETHNAIGECSWDADCTGLREGFQVVSCKPGPADLELIGAVPMNARNAQLVKEAIERMLKLEREKEPEKKLKVQ